MLVGPMVARFGKAIDFQAGRRQDRSPPSGYTLYRYPEFRSRLSSITKSGVSTKSRPNRLQWQLYATRRGICHRNSQHRHGSRPCQRHDHHLQRRLRTLRAATLPDAQPDGSQNQQASPPTSSPSKAWTSCTAPQHTVLPDMIEVGSFIGMAAMTRSELTIKNVSYENLGIIPDSFRRLGIKLEQ